MRKWLFLGLIVVVCGFLLTLTHSPAPAKKPAPDFLLPDLQGQVVRLSQLKGKVVLLNVWTTWCPPCRKEMPTMEALYRRLKSADFVMLAASQDVDGQNTVLPYLQEGGFTFPVLLDVHGEVGRKYGVTGYPETFIIDRQGTIVYHHIGYNDWSQPTVETALRRLTDQGVWMVWTDGKTPGEQTPLTQAADG
ncbi:MAG: TlpA family protein disulfide reductase [Deltaproteobacteria bacterium]|nr:TlpA family protein disulfide reductase [Deltaproteobacteria bacterium]